MAGLQHLGITGIEAAPGRIAPWPDLTSARLDDYRSRAAGHGIAIVALQGLFYGEPQAQLLGDKAGFALMRTRMHAVADAGARLRAGIAMFGAGQHRLRHSLPLAQAQALATERLSELATIAANAGMLLALEAVPAASGADFLNTTESVTTLVRTCAHPALRAHFDSAAALLAGEDAAAEIARAGPLLAHCHATEPGLADFAAPACDHTAVIAALRAIGYQGYVTIELGEHPDPLPRIGQAVRVLAS